MLPLTVLMVVLEVGVRMSWLFTLPEEVSIVVRMTRAPDVEDVVAAGSTCC